MPAELANSFSALWESPGSFPDVFVFLEEHPDASLPEKLNVLLNDQKQRWSRGQPLAVEAYLNWLPNLAADQEARLRLAVGEFEARLSAGIMPSRYEFATRFPDLGDSLQSKLLELASGRPEESAMGTAAFLGEATGPSIPVPGTATGSGQMAPDSHGAALTGQHLGRYGLQRLLGEGAFGRVWLGIDEELRRQVAIKVPRSEWFEKPEDAEAYLAEARMLATLDHPNIVPIYDVGRLDSGAVYVVSKFIDGATLEQRIREKRRDPHEAARLIAAIADALQHAHGRGLIHRDVKPANILIEESTRRPYLADFGLAVGLGKSLQAFHIAGSPAYMSPEQAGGDNERLDGRSDIFSLGVVLYEFLTGERPFSGRNINETLQRVIRANPKPPRAVDNTVPAELEWVCLKALAKAPAGRYARAAEMAEDLRRWQQQQTPELADQKTGPHNLPASLGPLIGRARDVADVRQLLAEARLVTLTGPGGIGKTHLGVQAAQELLPDFPDGVYLVELAAIRDPALVVAAIAGVVDCRETRERSLLEALQDWLGSRRVLLLLDNFEQVLTAAVTVEQLLSVCPNLRVLATSRARLHVAGEAEYSVPLLALPELNPLPNVLALAQYSAVALFVQRARQAVSSFRLDSQNAAAVAEVCVRMEGLPLAIELAAARVKVLPPPALLQRLKSRLKLLTGGRGDAPERQQTLRAAIAWSYDLLNADEQILFRRLSVFEGGFTLEAAESVIALTEEGPDVLDGVTALLDNSLLRRTEATDGTPRFSQLETVREFALEHLESSGEREALRRRHADFFVRLAEELDPRLNGPDAVASFQQLDREHTNIRAVLEWSTTGISDRERDDLGLRMGGCLWRYWCNRGHLREGRRWLTGLLRGSERDDAVTAKARYAAGCVAEDLGEYAEARALYEQAHTVWQALGDRRHVADALIALGSICNSRGEFVEARDRFERALAVSREVGDRRTISVALSNLGSISWAVGDYDASEAYHKEALAIRRELKNPSAVAVSLTSLGLVAARRGDFEAAQQYHQESLDMLRVLQNPTGVAVCLNNLGEIKHRLGDVEGALSLLAEGAKIQHGIGDRLSLAYTLETYASAIKRQGNFGRAVQLFGVAHALRAALGAPLPPSEQVGFDQEVQECRTALGEHAFAAAWQAGLALSVDESVASIVGQET